LKALGRRSGESTAAFAARVIAADKTANQPPVHQLARAQSILKVRKHGR
jgi:hypothetical protein